MHALATPDLVPSVCDDIASIYEQAKGRPLATATLDQCRDDAAFRGKLKRMVLDRGIGQHKEISLRALIDAAKDYHYSYGIGLGDLVAKGLEAVGIKKRAGCGCGQRQALLNRWASLGGRKPAIQPHEWTVAVTTAPREPSTLMRCVASIIRAGWWELSIISEPCVDLASYDVPGITTVQHAERRGCWHNYLFTLRWMLANYPKAKWLLVMQDDTVLAGPGMRQWCEYNCNAHVNDDALAIYSLYTSLKYRFSNWKKTPIERGELTPRSRGWNRIGVGRGLHGACAFIWRRDAAEEFVSDEKYVLRRKVKRLHDDSGQPYYLPPQRLANIDEAVGQWLKRYSEPRRNIYFAIPSLAEHIATTSTIGHGGNGYVRSSYDFLGEHCGFDCIEKAFHV